MTSDEKLDKEMLKIEKILGVSEEAFALKNENNKFAELASLLSPAQGLSRDIKRQIGGAFSGQNLVSFDSSNSREVILALVKLAIENKKKPVLVLTALNYKSAREILAAAAIPPESVVIIDTVSKNIKAVKDGAGVFFIDSLRDLTQIEIRVVNILSKEKNTAFIFDSLDTLAFYHEDKVIYKYAYSLTKILRKSPAPAFYLLNKKSLVSQLGQFFDNSVVLSKFKM